MNFSIVGIQVVKTYFKKQSTEVVIWKIQIKIFWYTTLLQMKGIKKLTNNIENVR